MSSSGTKTKLVMMSVGRAGAFETSHGAGEVGFHDAEGDSEGLNDTKLTLDGGGSEGAEDRAEHSRVIMSKQDCVQFCLSRATNC